MAIVIKFVQSLYIYKQFRLGNPKAAAHVDVYRPSVLDTVKREYNTIQDVAMSL